MRRFEYDVAVIGGGLGGTFAGAAAAVRGARTVIIERGTCFGGTATCGEVCEINGAFTKDGRCVMPATARALFERGIARGAIERAGWIAMTSDPAHGCDRIRFNPAELKLMLDELVMSSGAQTIFMASPSSIRYEDGAIAIEIGAPYDRTIIRAKTMIDSTGSCGAIYMLDPDSTIKTPEESRQGATLIFRLGGVDMERFMTNIEASKLQSVIDRGISSGAMKIRILAICPLPGMNEISLNITRADCDAEDPISATRAIIEMREQIERAIPFLKRELAGLERAHLTNIANALGVRERRRLDGMIEVIGRDLVKAAPMKGAIAFGCYPVDIHREAGGKSVQFTDIEGGGIYSIPYGSMISSRHRSIAVGCRAISSDDTAFAAFRTMPTVMGIGLASGIAAAIAARDRIDMRTMDISLVQDELREEYPDCAELIF